LGEVITTNLWTWAREWAANEALVCLLLAVEWTVAKLIAHRASIDETPTKLTAILTRRNLRIGLTAVRGAPPRTLGTIQVILTFILTVRAVTCQIVALVLVDRTATGLEATKLL
jgi:hypothetical protein